MSAPLREARAEWTASAFGQWMPGGPCAAIADCLRCGAPAHPIRGYCGRFCEEATVYDAAEQRARLAEHTIVCSKPGYSARIANIVDPPTDARTYADIEAEMRAAVAAIEALGPVPVRMRMPSTVWSALRAQVPTHEAPPASLALLVEIDNDLPSRTVRVVYSDGTHRDERV